MSAVPTTRNRRISLRFSVRFVLIAVTIIAIFLGGWTVRDTSFGRWFRPYTLERQVTVSAKNNEADPLLTGIYLKRGDLITFNPSKTDRWSAHGPNGPLADYSGSPGYPARLRLHFQIGNQSGFVADGTSIQVAADGPLELFCSDEDVRNNHGSIRVGVTLASSTRPADVPASKVIPAPNIPPPKPGTPAWFAE